MKPVKRSVAVVIRRSGGPARGSPGAQAFLKDNSKKRLAAGDRA
jgi:hypothetical protein